MPKQDVQLSVSVVFFCVPAQLHGTHLASKFWEGQRPFQGKTNFEVLVLNVFSVFFWFGGYRGKNYGVVKNRETS